jgi:hypothetical protein
MKSAKSFSPGSAMTMTLSTAGPFSRMISSESADTIIYQNDVFAESDSEEPAVSKPTKKVTFRRTQESCFKLSWEGVKKFFQELEPEEPNSAYTEWENSVQERVFVAGC